MEQYIVSARKYRPSSFATVVGQGALTATLKNAIATDRLAHAYLFCGSRGVGKTSCARIFAKTINCSNLSAAGEACNECASCQAFNDGNSLNIIELDAASHNGIDDIKQVIEQVQVPPTHGRYRVFIIDEVHMLSAAAFNAFLKTLEEPPSYAIFILATTEKHKIIPTILSRCQIYDFSRITINDMVAHLQHVAESEGITAEPAALNVIARQADGAMRDALSIFDQVAASSRGNITYESTIESLNVLDNSYYDRLADCMIKGDIPGALVIFHEIRDKGFDGQFFINGLGEYLRQLMLAGAPSTLPLIDEPDDVRAQLAAMAERVTPDFLYRAMSLCNDADLNYRLSSNKQMLIELTLIKISQLLSPSPDDSGRGEGPLKPIQKPQGAQATAAAAPAAAPASQAAATPQAPIHTAPARPAAPSYSAPAAQPQSPAAMTHVMAAQAAMGAQAARSAATRPGAGAPTMRVGRLSMSGPRQQAPDANATHEHRQEPFTPIQVAQAWQAFIENNRREHALVNVMKTCCPQRADNGTYVAVIGSDIEANKLRESMGAILASVRDAIRNDDFAFELTISNEGPSPRFWTEKEVLAYMLEQHSNFRTFVSTFNLR